MGLPGTRGLFAALVALAGTTLASDNKVVVVKTAATTSSATIATPCVATSMSGAFYDLRPDIVVAPADGAKPTKGVPAEDYLARGHDYGSNFTLNICAAVVKPPEDVTGISSSAWKNVSAYYQANGKTYSLGQQSSSLVSRGRRLVLQYTDGSPCGGSDVKKRGIVHSGANSKGYQDEEKDYLVSSSSSTSASGSVKSTAATERRKSATLSFLCDPDPMNTEAAVSFVDKDPYECAYFFEVRSHHACPGVEPAKPGSLGPGSVFAIILLIAVLVYVVGGVFYQRTVAHARGWRQLPNYSLWLGIWNFLTDIFVILTSSCARFIPSRRGYRSLAISPTRRGRDRESENRLIDQLDEEWDD